MCGLAVIVPLLVLLFGGLGLFVAKVFLFGLLIALLVGVVGGDAARAALRARIIAGFSARSRPPERWTKHLFHTWARDLDT
jgi:uncharacterized membrane-anchored protein